MRRCQDGDVLASHFASFLTGNELMSEVVWRQLEGNHDSPCLFRDSEQTEDRVFPVHLFK